MFQPRCPDLHRNPCVYVSLFPATCNLNLFLTSVVRQEYEGRHCDVTITPWKGEENVLSSFAKMLKNVNTEEFHVMTIVGFRVVVFVVVVAIVGIGVGVLCIFVSCRFRRVSPSS